jgi:hypothetical protein
MKSTILAVGLGLIAGSALAADLPDQRRFVFIERFVATHREEACGMHWVDNPSFAACMAALRREAEAAYAKLVRG